MEAMAVRCKECGYNNNLEYRYCGMCGAPLPMDPPVRTAAKELEGKPASAVPAPRVTAPAAPPVRPRVAPPIAAPPVVAPPVVAPPAPEPVVAAAPRPAPQPAVVSTRTEVAEESVPLSGPSFLGLDSKPQASHTYLLEDDEPSSGSRGFWIVVLLALILAGGFAYLHFRAHGVPWAQPASPSTGPQGASGVSNEPQPSTPMPATNAPQQATQEPPPALPTPGQANTTQTPEPQKTDTQAAPAQPAAADTTAAATPKANDATAEPSTPAPAKPAAKQEEPAAPPAKPVRTAKAAPTPVKPDVSGPDAENEALVSQGEKYLYGTGVKQNCDLAQKSLMAAASHQSARAQSMLGTMYATGHCANRNLVLAYRWFAKALHSDPHNTRISTDLEVLWRQMTPEERALATTSGR